MSNFDPFGNIPNGGQQQDGQPLYSQPPQQPDDPAGRSAMIFGILAIVLAVVCCQLVGLVLGIVALVRAGTSVRNLGFQSSQAQAGKILGIVSIVISALYLLFVLLMFAVPIVLALLESGGGGTVV